MSDEVHIENPVIREDTDADTEALRQMIAQEEGQAPEVHVPQAELPKAPTDVKTTTPAEDVHPKVPAAGDEKPTVDPPRDEQGRFTKADGSKSQPNEVAEAAQPAEKAESAYTKAQKEAARREKTWVQVNERRAEVERREAELSRRERELQERQQQPQTAPTRYSSDQLRKVALEFQAEAKAHRAAENFSEAAESAQLAADAFLAAGQAEKEEAEEQSKGQQTQFSQVFAANTNTFGKEVPDVLNPESEISKQLVELFNEEPMLNFHPQGVRKGYELLQLREKAGRVDAAEAKVKELQAEIDRFKGITSLGGDPVTGPTRKLAFDELPIDQQTAELERMVANADATQF